MCIRIAPDVFQLGEDDVSRVVATGPLEGELLELAEDAIECCPVEAISLTSDDAVESPVWRMDADPRRQG
jgi:ferredoxin